MGDNGDTWLPISTMDDLLKRQIAGAGVSTPMADGGDLNGGDGLHPARESDVGSDVDSTGACNVLLP